MDATPDPMALFVLAFFALGWFLYAVMLHRVCCERDRLRERIDERDEEIRLLATIREDFDSHSRQTPHDGYDLSIYDEYRQQREAK